MKNLIFPFTAIVGQEKVKKALILNAINPSIGGVLIRGDKGTGKTTAVRALADLLPSIKTVKGCPFNCDPEDKDSLCQLCKSKDIEVEEKKMRVVELPLGSTEDRVVGSLDIKKALKEGIKALEPGILAEANRNILYVDEINLLDDHLVDVLLDAAAYGVNYVEREGISISHPSKFILVGTMNPAEGELRPQLADRIGLHINVETIQDIKERVEIMARREKFEEEPENFRKEFEKEQEKLLKRIIKARKLLNNVKIDKGLLELIARICVNVGVDGHRADIAILKASKTLAAYNGRTRVMPEDLEEAVELVLGERIPERSYARQDVQRQIQRAKTEMEQGESQEAAEGEAVGGENPPSDEKKHVSESRQPSLGSANLKMTPNPHERTPQEEEVEIDLKKLIKFKGKKNRRLYGSRVESKTEKGKYVKSKMLKGKSKDIAIDATLRAAALKSEESIKVEPEDLREKIRKHGARAAITLVVDISGSMFTDQKAAKIKNILNKIIQDTQRHKDKLSIIGFKGRKAEIIIPTTKRAQSFQQKVDNIKVGGTTPMAHGIKKGLEILKEEKKKEEYVPVMLVLSDGMPNVGMKGRPIQDVMELGRELNKNEIHTVVINFEKKFQQGRNINMELAMLSGGRYYDIDQLNDPSLAIPKIMDYERNQF